MSTLNDRSNQQPAEGSGFLSGLLFGALIGAGVAMILAPQTGEDTRDFLRAKAREASGRVRDAAGDTNDLLERGRKIVEEAKARIDASVDEGKAAADQQRTTLEHNT
jgi:gas vesicle protein